MEIARYIVRSETEEYTIVDGPSNGELMLWRFQPPKLMLSCGYIVGENSTHKSFPRLPRLLVYDTSAVVKFCARNVSYIILIALSRYASILSTNF